MQRYLFRRVIFSLFAIWATITLTFIFMRALPGDPITTMVGNEGDPSTIEGIKARLGLDQPVPIQYLYYLRAMTTLDLGDSIYLRLPVVDQIKAALPRSLSLAFISFLVAIIIGIPAGIISATRRYSIWDHGATMAAFLGLAMPSFWLGIILILLIGVQFNLLPVFGYIALRDSSGLHFWPWFSHLILPALATGTGSAAILARQTRSAMLETLSQDYIRTAYAKGLRERVVIWRHAFRNSLIPVITVMGIILALLLNGIVITENVFAIKGLGRLLVDAILGRDYPIVQGVILMTAVLFIFANLLVDVLYAFINPRIRYDS
ncbi:MAG: ABC transporter permease [Chloroflexi bacterium]|nr:ABC transporter permease [Chloroflexota bacterium]